jgi:hypothetical protein
MDDDPLEALARYQRREGMPPSEMLEGMISEESDRGIVIILGSWIEDELLNRIEQKFQPMSGPERKRLIERGPLRDFNARILFGRALGILSEKDAEVLTTIKAMRNACAHSRQDISFQTPELRAVLLSVLSDQDRRIVEKAPIGSIAATTAFITACSFVLGILKGETVAEAHARIKGAQMHLRDSVELRESSRRTRNDKSEPDRHQPPTGKGR